VSDLSAWVLSIGSFAAIVLLTAFAAKSFVGDAARGRRRCPRCWHELGPAPATEGPDGGLGDGLGVGLGDGLAREAARRALQCGECGFAAAHEADTLRTRRRAGLGILAVVAILAIVGAADTRRARSGSDGLRGGVFAVPGFQVHITGSTVTFRDVADTKDRITATMTGSERTAVTRDPA
jgi:hypothetical protein